jgi:Asp-tRNA(Asn)/Glu-tRNA(Gln) amidotransferase A subunit family amidase
VSPTSAAGDLILAKTNPPEFGAGGNTTNRVYGPTGNPFDAAKTCGGSSGGSAVAERGLKFSLGDVRRAQVNQTCSTSASSPFLRRSTC